MNSVFRHLLHHMDFSTSDHPVNCKTHPSRIRAWSPGMVYCRIHPSWALGTLGDRKSKTLMRLAHWTPAGCPSAWASCGPRWRSAVPATEHSENQQPRQKHCSGWDCGGWGERQSPSEHLMPVGRLVFTSVGCLLGILRADRDVLHGPKSPASASWGNECPKRGN